MRGRAGSGGDATPAMAAHGQCEADESGANQQQGPWLGNRRRVMATIALTLLVGGGAALTGAATPDCRVAQGGRGVAAAGGFATCVRRTIHRGLLVLFEGRVFGLRRSGNSLLSWA